MKAETVLRTLFFLILVNVVAFGGDFQLKHIDCNDILKILDAPFERYDDEPFEELRRMFHLGRRPHPELIHDIIERIDNAPDAPPGTLGYDFYRSRWQFMRPLGVNDEEGALQDLLAVRTFISDPTQLRPDDEMVTFYIQTDGSVDTKTGMSHDHRTAIRLAEFANIGILKGFVKFERTVLFAPEENLFRDRLRSFGTTVMSLVATSNTHPLRTDAARGILNLADFYATGVENLLRKHSGEGSPKYVVPERIFPTLRTILDTYPALAPHAEAILKRFPTAEGNLFD